MNILCVGFYGHGNAGDEAMARSWDRYLVRPFDNTFIRYATEASPDQLAKVNADNSYYAANRYIQSVYDTEAMASYDIVIVGGGHLSPTYGVPLLIRAKELRRAKLLARIGSSVRGDFLYAGSKAIALAKSSIEMFDFISVRDRMALDAVAAMGLSPHVGADIAIEFPVTDQTDVGLKTPYVVVAVREVRHQDIERQVEIVRSVLGTGLPGVQRHAANVYLLPFCEPDQRFLDVNGLSFPGVEVLRDVWRSPERVASIISRAAFTLSIGRLHPLIFSFSNRVPCACITYPDKHAEELRNTSVAGYNKMVGFMDLAGLSHRVIDWDTPTGAMNESIIEAFKKRGRDRQIMDINGGFLKKRMLESLIPVWKAMNVDHGLGLERGLKKGEFRVDDYDDTYMHGARVYKNGKDFQVWDPPRCDWDGWDRVGGLVVSTLRPRSVLDVGCGRGFFLRRMLTHGVPAAGLECSEAAWSDAPAEVKSIIRVVRIEDVTQQYDVVTAFDVMEHIYEEDIANFVGHMKRIATRYIALNICASPEGGPIHTIRRGQPIPDDLEWLAVSGHVTIRHRSWWKAQFEDSLWHSDEDIHKIWLSSLGFPAWEAHNLLILKRAGA
jgi:polysaccharide pyruvyl transferase WcaK-like protein/SAM-dependent methyltransferase